MIVDKGSVLTPFGDGWITLMRKAEHFKTWDASTDSHLFDIFEAKHPYTQEISSATALGMRLQGNLQALQLEENLSPTITAAKENIYKGLDVGKESINKAWQAGVEKFNDKGALSDLGSSAASGATSVVGLVGGWGTFLSGKARNAVSNTSYTTNPAGSYAAADGPKPQSVSDVTSSINWANQWT